MITFSIKAVGGVPIGTQLRCIQEHPDGKFIVGEIYRLCNYRMKGRYLGVRIRDSKRERKDFNFIPDSKNYLWRHFEKIETIK